MMIIAQLMTGSFHFFLVPFLVSSYVTCAVLVL